MSEPSHRTNRTETQDFDAGTPCWLIDTCEFFQAATNVNGFIISDYSRLNSSHTAWQEVERRMDNASENVKVRSLMRTVDILTNTPLAELNDGHTDDCGKMEQAQELAKKWDRQYKWVRRFAKGSRGASVGTDEDTRFPFPSHF